MISDERIKEIEVGVEDCQYPTSITGFDDLFRYCQELLAERKEKDALIKKLEAENEKLRDIAEVFKDSIGNHEIPCDCSSCQIYEAWKETNA